MNTEGPLSGLQVIEFANVLAGPSVGMSLAELGATVIKIESTLAGGDVTRSWKHPSESRRTDISAYFSCANWGKRSLALNLKDPDGVRIAHALVAESDIVLVSYKPGDAEKLRVDSGTLRELNPRLIHVHLSGYGNRNPRGGYDALIQAESGFTYMNGDPDGGPVKMPVALMDVLAGHQMKEAVLLALLEREKTKLGRAIEVSLLESGLASLANQAANWLVVGVVPGRMGSDHPNIVPYGTVFTCRDGREIVFAVGTDRQFREFCEALNLPELMTDPRYTTNHDRVAHRPDLIRALEEAIVTWERDELLALMIGRGVPVGAVRDMREVFKQRGARDLILEAVTSTGTRLRGVRTVVFRSGSDLPQSALLPPPHYGEHTVVVLRDTLGLADEEIEGLIERGVVRVGTRS